MIKKTYRLSDEAVEILSLVMEENAFKTENAAIDFLIMQYGKKQEQEEKMVQRIVEQLSGHLRTAAAAARSADQKATVMLDGLNTILIERGYRHYYSADTESSPVITEARLQLQKRLEKSKQYKDDRRNRQR